jgi:type I restriction enzyme S subunit
VKYNAYQKYKPSGVAWLGEVPVEWQIRRLKYLANKSDKKTEADENQLLPYIGLEHIESWTGKLLPLDPDLIPTGICNRFGPGETLIGKLRPNLAKACNVDFTGLCSSELLVLSAQRLDRNFLLYSLLCRGFISLVDSSTYGAKMPRANWEFIGSCFLPLPSLNEQHAVSRFLDRETNKIDTLLAKKQALIEKLKEKRTALISRTVTRGLPPEAALAAGLDPHPKLKPSGVEWLGDIPEHWEVKKLSWLFRYSKGPNAAMLTKEYVGSNTGEFPVFSGQTENDGLMGMIDSFEFDFPRPIILVTTVGARAMTTRLISGKFSLSQNCALIIPRDHESNVSYYQGVLQSLFDY